MNRKKVSPPPPVAHAEDSNGKVKKERKPRLGSILEAPDFLRVPYILTGYRLDHNFLDCAISLFTVHNETINVWTHVLGAMAGGFLITNLLVHSVPQSFMYEFVPIAHLLVNAICLLISATFHGFNCIDEHAHYNLRIMDFCGIGVGILSAGWPVVYFTWVCNPVVLSVYTFFTAIITPLLLVMPFATFFHDKRMLRTWIFIIAAGMPAYVGTHYFLLYGLSAPLNPILFWPIVLTYAAYGVGVVLYVSRVPEKWWPGAFDNIVRGLFLTSQLIAARVIPLIRSQGTSHQIWHLLCLVGMWYLQIGITGARDFRLAEGACHLTVA